MKRINNVQEVYKYCNPDYIKVVYSKNKVFKTNHPSTAIVLQQMGHMYYISCITPGTTCIDNLIEIPPLTMRAAPKLIRERLDFLAGESAHVHPAAKHALYRALAATPELEMLNELEGDTREPLDEILPWGISADACKLIRDVYKLHHSYQDAGASSGGHTNADPKGAQRHEPEAEPFGRRHDGGSRKW